MLTWIASSSISLDKMRNSEPSSFFRSSRRTSVGISKDMLFTFPPTEMRSCPWPPVSGTFRNRTASERPKGRRRIIFLQSVEEVDSEDPTEVSEAASTDLRTTRRRIRTLTTPPMHAETLLEGTVSCYAAIFVIAKNTSRPTAVSRTLPRSQPLNKHDHRTIREMAANQSRPCAFDSAVSSGDRVSFSHPITVKNDTETHADLDSCAEVDVVSYEFVKNHRLEQARLTAPLITAINRRKTPTYGIWRVPITVVDSVSATRSCERSCVAIDRDPRLEGSPILLSMTTLCDLRIHLSAWNRKWWFETSATELLPPHKLPRR